MSANPKETVAAKVREIAERVGASEQIEIVDVELLGGGGHRVLRLFIDKPGGVTHGDCEYISQNVGTILDVEDVVPGDRYTLEVSSPGVERKLARPRDFERSVGSKIKVSLRQPVEGQSRWEGKLAAFDAGWATLEAGPSGTIRFPIELIDKANLKFEW